jgi:hypothetical protein
VVKSPINRQTVYRVHCSRRGRNRVLKFIETIGYDDDNDKDSFCGCRFQLAMTNDQGWALLPAELIGCADAESAPPGVETIVDDALPSSAHPRGCREGASSYAA